jgi:hypothetical protein
MKMPSKPAKSQAAANGDAPLTLSDLSPNGRNPRKITNARLGSLRRALREFGDLGGITFNRQTKRLVGGHQRTKLLGQDKDAKVVVTERLATPDRWGSTAFGYVQMSDGSRFSYREVDWSEQRETAAMLAANAQGGEWIKDSVNILLSELDKGGFDIDLTGLELPGAVKASDGANLAVTGKFEVCVECADEKEQEQIYEQLTEEGRSCRLLTY